MSETISPVRLLLLAWEYPPPLVGGSLVYLHSLVSHIPSDAVVAVLAPSTHDLQSQEEFDHAQAYPVFRADPPYSGYDEPGKLGKLVLLIRRALILHTLIVRHRYNILLIDKVFPLGLLGLAAHLIYRVPYILVAFGEEFTLQRASKSIWHRIRAQVYQLGYSHAAGVIAISDFTIEQVKWYGVPESRIVKIMPPYIGPYDMPAPSLIQQVTAQYRLDGKRIILCTGRLIERKGQDHLLKAMPLILQKIPNAILILVGQGLYEPTLRQLITAYQLESSVVLLGEVNTDILTTLYALCEVFVMPNRTLPNGDTEGFGIVFIEANAFRKPAIGGRAGGTSDAVIDGVTGFLVDGNNVENIAQRVIEVLSDSALAQRLGAAGHARVFDELTPERAGSRLLALASTLIEARSVNGGG